MKNVCLYFNRIDKSRHIPVNFRSAIRIGETVKVKGWPEVHRGRLFIMKGKITHADGTPAAEAKAEMMLAK